MTPPSLMFWRAASRAVSAILGGYVVALTLTAALTLTLQRTLGWSRGDALVTASMFAFLAWLVVALRVFVTASARRAWVEVLTAAISFATLAWALR